MIHAFAGLSKNVFRAFLLFLSFAVPIKSYAVDCSACYYSGFTAACSECAAVVQKLEVLINSSTSDINQNINVTREALSKKIDTATNAIVAAIEKQTAAEHQLSQGDLNYKAATGMVKVVSEAQDKFTQPAADLMDPKDAANACATMATATAATAAGDNALLTARSLAAMQIRKNLYTSNSGGVLQQEIQIYNTTFCSDQAEKRGTCKKVSGSMQDADQNAGSLLAPLAGRTYTKDESTAAQQFIANVMGPIPQEVLPIVLEKTPAGQRFMVEQRSLESVKSMASFSLNAILSNNSADDLSDGAPPSMKVSLVGLMKKYVEDRFGSLVYRDSLAKLNEIGLLRQIAENAAFQNWMDYQQYLQGERTEGLLATTLALNARERTERILPAIRQQVSAR